MHVSLSLALRLYYLNIPVTPTWDTMVVYCFRWIQQEPRDGESLEPCSCCWHCSITFHGILTSSYCNCCGQMPVHLSREGTAESVLFVAPQCKFLPVVTTWDSPELLLLFRMLLTCSMLFEHPSFKTDLLRPLLPTAPQHKFTSALSSVSIHVPQVCST